MTCVDPPPRLLFTHIFQLCVHSRSLTSCDLEFPKNNEITAGRHSPNVTVEANRRVPQQKVLKIPLSIYVLFTSCYLKRRKSHEITLSIHSPNVLVNSTRRAVQEKALGRHPPPYRLPFHSGVTSSRLSPRHVCLRATETLKTQKRI